MTEDKEQPEPASGHGEPSSQFDSPEDRKAGSEKNARDHRTASVAAHAEEDVHQHGAQDLQAVEAHSRTSTGPAYSVFSQRMKWWIVVMNCFAVSISPMTGNIYFPALPALADDLGVSTNLINLSLTTYMIFQAIAPTLFGDLGDAAGRRPAFIIAFIIYLGASIGLALQRNYAALLVLRMLQSGGSSGTIALSYAVVADISSSSERGRYMGIMGAGISVGPSVGPIIGGVLVEYLGWPSIFWFCAIVTVVFLVPYILAVPETGRKVVGNGSIPPRGWNMTLLDYIRFCRQPRDRSISSPRTKLPIPNPLNALKVVFQKDMGMLLLYNATLYVGFMVVAATISTQFSEIYHFNELQLGLCYIPIGVASSISSISQGYITDWNFRRIAKKTGLQIDRRRGESLKDFPIEKVRIDVVWPMVILGTIVCIAYGWSLQAEVHVAVPLVLSFFIGLGVAGSFSLLNVLVVDLYPHAPATATAANNLVRCLLGAVGTAVIEDMIKGMGRGWAYTLLALLFAVFSPILWVLQKHGPRWREERRKRAVGVAGKVPDVKEEAGQRPDGDEGVIAKARRMRQSATG